MYGVVLTDLVQFILMTIVSIWVGVIAINQVSGEQIAELLPDGWFSMAVGRELNIDWSGLVPQLHAEMLSENYALYQAFGAFFAMAIINGILKSLAGPFPGYDMQRILACRNSREAALMSGMISPILMLPRYFMVAGIMVLALMKLGEFTSSDAFDFDRVLPFVIRAFMPVGLVGLVLAGLLAAFMSTFDSTVNSGAAYLVNDVYKRYFQRAKHEGASSSDEIWMSYACSLFVVALGIALGYHFNRGGGESGRIDTILNWVTVGLGSGYIAPNVLKWYWWRLNGEGYFAGMVTGTALAILQTVFSGTALAFLPEQPLYAFPYILAASFVVTVLASLATRPVDDELLKSFYRMVRPWGFWEPIKQKCLADDPSFTANRAMVKDLSNCLVGVVWQTSLMALPVYLVVRKLEASAVCAVIVVVATVWLKFSWFDRLEPAAED